MTKDVEMAARNGNGNGAFAGENFAYELPGGDADFDDDGKPRRTGKKHDQLKLKFSLIC